MITTSIRTTAIALTAIAFVGTAASAAEIDAPSGTGLSSLDYSGTWFASDHSNNSDSPHSIWLPHLFTNTVGTDWSFDTGATLTVTAANAAATLSGTVSKTIGTDSLGFNVSVAYHAASPVLDFSPTKIKAGNAGPAMEASAIANAPEWALYDMSEDTVETVLAGTGLLDGMVVSLIRRPGDSTPQRLFTQMGNSANDKNENPGANDVGFSNWFRWNVDVLPTEPAGLDLLKAGIGIDSQNVGDFNLNLTKVGGGGGFEPVPEVSAAGSLAAFASLLGLMALIRERRVGASRRI